MQCNPSNVWNVWQNPFNGLKLLALAVCVVAMAAGCGGRHGRLADRKPPPQDTQEVSAAGTQGSLMHDGIRRTYILYRPAQLSQQRAVPLVIALHGGYGEAANFAQTTGFNQVADRNGFMVVYPNGVDKHWADGRDPSADKVDDVSFIRALIDHLVSTQGVDPKRVYVTGHSNGGTMTLRLACELSDRIAAFASVAANFTTAYAPLCAPRKPVSVMMINGTDDSFMPYSGGSGKGTRVTGDRGTLLSTPDSWQVLVRANGCASQPLVSMLPDLDPSDGMRVEQRRFSQCKGGAEIVVLSVQGGGHTWPGTDERTARQMLTGKPVQDIDGAEEIWKFFSRH